MSTSVEVTSPLKWHGGKYYLVPPLVQIGRQAPNVIHRCEHFGGSLAWTLANDPEEASEVVNDTHGGLMNFWRVMQERPLFLRMKRTLEAVPFSQPQWKRAQKWLEAQRCSVRDLKTNPCHLHAAQFFIFARQCMAGRLGKPTFAPLSRTRIRRGMNEQASAWIGAVAGLPKVHRRMIRVAILEDDFRVTIKSQDGPNTLHYLDPTYLPDTRATVGEYEGEMTVADHEAILTLCGGMAGHFILSGYWSNLYADAARTYGWKCVKFDLPNNAAGGKGKERKEEHVWTNFDHSLGHPVRALTL